jgi:hypothetical protein
MTPTLHPHPRPLPARGRGVHAELTNHAHLLDEVFSRSLEETISLLQDKLFAHAMQLLLPSPLRGGVGGGGQLARTPNAGSLQGRPA